MVPLSEGDAFVSWEVLAKRAMLTSTETTFVYVIQVDPPENGRQLELASDLKGERVDQRVLFYEKGGREVQPKDGLSSVAPVNLCLEFRAHIVLRANSTAPRGER